MLFALRSIRRSMARPVPGAPSRLGFSNRACRLRAENGFGVAPFAAGLRRFRFVPTQGSRQKGSLAWGRLALVRALVGPARHQLRWRFSSRVRVWPFPPFAGERKRSQTLKLSGGNTSWLTPNPSLKSASVASRLRYGATEPKNTRGTMSPFRVFTKTGRCCVIRARGEPGREAHPPQYTRSDRGIPSSAIRFSTAHLIAASTFWFLTVRAERLTPSIALYRETAFSATLWRVQPLDFRHS